MLEPHGLGGIADRRWWPSWACEAGCAKFGDTISDKSNLVMEPEKNTRTNKGHVSKRFPIEALRDLSH
jgi:hypothetical protein